MNKTVVHQLRVSKKTKIKIRISSLILIDAIFNIYQYFNSYNTQLIFYIFFPINIPTWTTSTGGSQGKLRHIFEF